ncbi:MAG: M24 family metallopeptidase [Thermoleophilia bacterium]
MTELFLPLVEPAATLTPAAETQARVEGLQAALAERGLDGALIVQNADLFYFTGMIQRSHLFVPARGEPTLFVRKTVARARLESPLATIVALPSVKELPLALQERYDTLPASLGLELDVLPFNDVQRLQTLLPGVAFHDIAGPIRRLRAIKSPHEIRLIERAAAVGDEVCRRIPGLLRAGLSEVEFAGRVEAEARALGHQGVLRMRGFNEEMFYGQVLSGLSGTATSYLDTPLAGTGLSPAVAQGASFKQIGRDEPIVFDFVPVIDGYMADFTRMFVIGKLAPSVRDAYDVALAVEAEVVRVARPGVTCRTVYEAGVAVAVAAGLGEFFMGHGPGQVRFLGHGVGVELDELPVIANSELELAEGMVFALEPKFVLPGHGAVGIENTWVVRAAGIEALTRAAGAVYEL